MKSNWLIPTDRQRSYYGKARVISYGTDGTLILISYNTPVCVWDIKQKNPLPDVGWMVRHDDAAYQ